MKKIFKKKRNIAILAVVVIIMIIAFIFIRRRISMDIKREENLTVTSQAFENDGIIPVKYTGKGEDVSPDLELSALSPDAKSIAIIMDDLDFPLGVFNHWVIWNIPADFSSIPEGISKREIVPELGNAVQGKSEYGGKHYYRGPLPPFGTHRYVFNVYVLDSVLNLETDAGRDKLMKAMEGHILQYGTITGRFGGK
jgi:Raf kinase inhibitor-like YbhB/YbcL family protein